MDSRQLSRNTQVSDSSQLMHVQTLHSGDFIYRIKTLNIYSKFVPLTPLIIKMLVDFIKQSDSIQINKMAYID